MHTVALPGGRMANVMNRSGTELRKSSSQASAAHSLARPTSHHWSELMGCTVVSVEVEVDGEGQCEDPGGVAERQVQQEHVAGAQGPLEEGVVDQGGHVAHQAHRQAEGGYLRLKMFREDHGSWMTMFFTTILSLFIFSNIYNLFLLMAGDMGVMRAHRQGNAPLTASAAMELTNSDAGVAAERSLPCREHHIILASE
ncbi:hypothetical protein CRUP_015286 [Coryphaenoides rupestris]|nr:hypothetical protein CRUP_015286 [Coryphaenoides rupestris]